MATVPKLAPASPTPPAATPLLDAQRLDVYTAALEFQTLACRLVPRRGAAELRDQLDRASTSIVLNIAEATCPDCLPISDGHVKRGSCAR